ncbi:hypothetical protein VTP01DRAFT_1552 [Rhizomucor pusillus]|uniref:uncharacterized protein n=1 Tax=Rhizomucor pusillus TaxID=4840 RepID=UPI003743166D
MKGTVIKTPHAFRMAVYSSQVNRNAGKRYLQTQCPVPSRDVESASPAGHGMKVSLLLRGDKIPSRAGERGDRALSRLLQWSSLSRPRWIGPTTAAPADRLALSSSSSASSLVLFAWIHPGSPTTHANTSSRSIAGTTNIAARRVRW